MVYDYVYQKENNVYESFDYFSHHDKYVVENLSSHASGKTAPSGNGKLSSTYIHLDEQNLII